MVFDRQCHVLTQTIVARVVAAHDALQFRKLADHIGQQISLGQLRCAIDGGAQRRVAQLRADGARECAHALHALALRAELVVVDHLVQARHTRGQRLLAVLVEEEFGIGQPRAHHALVAADDRAGIRRADVADHQEFITQFICCIEQREVLLVRLHGQNQALLRYIQKSRFKGADQHIRALDQAGDFIEQGLVLNRTQRRSNGIAASHDGRRRKLARNLGAALGKAGDHGTVFAQRLGVAVGVHDQHRRDLGFKTVPLCVLAGFESEHANRHHGAAVQRDQAVRRAHKLHAAPAWQFAVGLELIRHDLRNRQACNRLFQRLLQAGIERGTANQTVVEQRFGFAIGCAPQRRNGLRRV